ncbi:MAG: hypothetical protein A4E36_01209 [Methanoregulaceae archaeon PtaB.Bin009]|nr:MAG: hypothetical protein A4E36_01209 [Methanoregulaceae archaeon PtaB.Bin009]
MPKCVRHFHECECVCLGENHVVFSPVIDTGDRKWREKKGSLKVRSNGYPAERCQFPDKPFHLCRGRADVVQGIKECPDLIRGEETHHFLV